MSVTTAGPGRPARAPGKAATAAQVRRARLRAAVSARGIPLATILVSVAVVVLAYLAGKLAYRLRDVILMVVVAGFSRLDPESAGGRSAAAVDPAPRLGRGRGDHLNPWWSSPAWWPLLAIRWCTG
jgi:hypothetical protein